MRLELQPQPLRLDLDAESVPASEAEQTQRIIGGLVVPYGVEARVGPYRVTFAEGSVRVGDHVPLILAHNLDRPIGVMMTSAQSSGGLAGVFAVDRTPDGDVAIEQAKSGSRRGLSGGIDVIRADEDDDGRMLVHDAELAEVSQVVLAAFESAAITTVAAHAVPPNPEGGTMDQPTPTPEPQPAEAEPARPPIIVTAESQPERMRLGTFVQTMIRAHKGDRDAMVRVEAQLNREELADSPGVVPIAYVTQLVDSLESPRPLFDAFTTAELPPAGMTIRRPQITARPAGGWLATDADPAPTGPITIGNLDSDIEQWAHGVAASVALVERSSPSYVEEAFAQMVKSYYRAVEGRIASALEAITAPATTPPTTLGGAGALFVSSYGSWPNLLVAGPTAYGQIVDAIGPMRYATGSADLQGDAVIAGLRVVCAPNVTPADVWVTDRDLLESRESTPIRLSVSDVTSLSLEIGVTSFYALTTTRQTIAGLPGAVRIAGYVPAVAGPAQQSGGSSRRSS